MAPNWFVALALFLVLQPAIHADEAKGFRTIGIQLYLPDEAMRERVPDIHELADFIKAMQRVCTEAYAFTETAEALAIVAAVKPNRQTRFWFVSSQKRADKEFEPLRQKLAAIKAPTIAAGPVAFAVHASIAGGAPDKPSAEPPIPKEWADAANARKSTESLLIPDGFLKLVWPD